MNKLLNRIQSGPGLLVILLISFSLYFSFSLKSHQQTSSFNKIASSFNLFSSITLDVLESVDASDDIEVDFFQIQSRASVENFLFQTIRGYQNSFTYFKVPLLYFLFDIPPPAL